MMIEVIGYTILALAAVTIYYIVLTLMDGD